MEEVDCKEEEGCKKEGMGEGGSREEEGMGKGDSREVEVMEGNDREVEDMEGVVVALEATKDLEGNPSLELLQIWIRKQVFFYNVLNLKKFCHIFLLFVTLLTR